MNTTIKLGVAGALALGTIAAHASISLPATGASDAILFAEVLNSSGSAVASYAGDTGVTINQLVAGLASGSSTTVLGGDANLAKLFAANASGDTIQWAVLGGQYSGNATTSNFATAGHAQFITTSTGNSMSKLALDNTSNLTKWAALNLDVSAINTNSGGANSVEGPSASGAGVWDVNAPTTTGSAWYNNGPVTGNVLGSTPENLYYVTGNGSTGAKVSYAIEGTATLTSGGLVLAGSSPSTVPLPAAVWLLGSGLLGLTGVARRKLKV